VLIRPMEPRDAPEVLTIYQAGLDTGQASFETRAPSWSAFDAGRLPAPRLVAVGPAPAEAGANVVAKVVGWVAVTPVSSRSVYRGVVEHSVYVDPAVAGQGVGRRLLDALIGAADEAGIWTIQSSVFPENKASLALHARAGFRVVGVRERIGRHHGVWRDTVLIERRSPTLA
jgi:L-amino acid N-acyltransferase YncA